MPGVTRTPLRPEITAIAVPSTVDGGNMAGADFVVTVGWGHYGLGDAVMPGRGRAEERAYTPEETTAMLDALPVLGDKTFDVYLNGEASGATSPPRSGTTGSVATRSSRSGCPTASVKFSAGTFGPRKFSTSPTPRGGSPPCS